MRRMFGLVWAFCVVLSVTIIFMFTVNNGFFSSEDNPTHPPNLGSRDVLFPTSNQVGNNEVSDEKYRNDVPVRHDVARHDVANAPLNFDQYRVNANNNNEHVINVSLPVPDRTNSAINLDERRPHILNSAYQENRNSVQDGIRGSVAAEIPRRVGLENSLEHAPGNPYIYEKNNGPGQMLNSGKITLEQYYRTARTDKQTPLGWNLNPHLFNYIINSPSVCEPRDENDITNVFLLVMVPTSVTNHAKRTMIRQMWGKSSNFAVKIRVVFLLGKPETDPGAFLQDAIFEEQSLYKDLIQEEYVDTYSNLTYKTLSGLKWIFRYCPTARYVLKVDDHVFVNMPKLLEELSVLTYHPAYVIGNVRYEDEVHRSGRWAVEFYEWPMFFYPVFCVGPAYILSVPLAVRLFQLSKHVPFFRLEDVYTTGFVGLLATSPPPNYVQWDTRYHVNEIDFVESFTGSMYGKYLFSHVENTFSYPGVWSWIERHKMFKHMPNYEPIRSNDRISHDRSGLDSAYKRQSEGGDINVKSIDAINKSPAAEQEMPLSGSKPSIQPFNLQEERQRILNAWKKEQEERIRKKNVGVPPETNSNVPIIEGEQQQHKEPGLMKVAVNAALWLKRHQQNKDSSSSVASSQANAAINPRVDVSYKSTKAEEPGTESKNASSVQYASTEVQNAPIPDVIDQQQGYDSRAQRFDSKVGNIPGNLNTDVAMTLKYNSSNEGSISLAITSAKRDITSSITDSDVNEEPSDSGSGRQSASSDKSAHNLDLNATPFHSENLTLSGVRKPFIRYRFNSTNVNRDYISLNNSSRSKGEYMLRNPESSGETSGEMLPDSLSSSKVNLNRSTDQPINSRNNFSNFLNMENMAQDLQADSKFNDTQMRYAGVSSDLQFNSDNSARRKRMRRTFKQNGNTEISLSNNRNLEQHSNVVSSDDSMLVKRMRIVPRNSLSLQDNIQGEINDSNQDSDLRHRTTELDTRWKKDKSDSNKTVAQTSLRTGDHPQNIPGFYHGQSGNHGNEPGVRDGNTTGETGYVKFNVAQEIDVLPVNNRALGDTAVRKYTSIKSVFNFTHSVSDNELEKDSSIYNDDRTMNKGENQAGLLQKKNDIFNKFSETEN